MSKFLAVGVVGLACLTWLAGGAMARSGGGGGGGGNRGGHSGSRGGHAGPASHKSAPGKGKGANRAGMKHVRPKTVAKANAGKYRRGRPVARGRMVRRGVGVGVGVAGGPVEGDVVEGAVVEGGSAGQVAAAPVYGVLITEMQRGTAAKQGLRPGDIILSYNGSATPTFEALADAVQQSGNEAEVVFINQDNGEEEAITLFPVEGRIGVTVEPVQVD
jgi:hypothetical protein